MEAALLRKGAAVRARASKDVSVADLQGWLEGFMSDRGSRDLAGLLQPLFQKITWKNGPQPELLHEFCDLFSWTALKVFTQRPHQNDR